ncbi:TPA: cobalamin biosynthesis protein [Klebsiella pneumoniae]
MTLLAWCVAWILDVVIGDPPHWPHPVRWIGRLIAVSQRVVRRVCHSDRALRIGGAPLAMAYKAVNTLDSMVGYKHEKYRAIGMVSARLDDVANFLPARLSWLLLSLAAVLCREDGARALRTGWRDRYQHSSPNCAWPEATVAGALGIRLGGPNDYFGQRVEKPWIGDAVRDIAVDDISRTIRLMWVASSLALALFIGVRYWLVGAA